MTLSAIGLLSGVLLGSIGTVINQYESPAQPFWGIWAALLFPFIVLWIGLFLLGGFAWPAFERAVTHRPAPARG